MTALPKIPKSAVAVLTTAGITELEDLQEWSANEAAALRGFGPKAFTTVQAAMDEAGLPFDPMSPKRADDINRAMAEERMKDAPPEPSGPSDLPKIGRPATRALATIGVRNMDDLSGKNAQDLLALHGFGPKALRILRDAGTDL